MLFRSLTAIHDRTGFAARVVQKGGAKTQRILEALERDYPPVAHPLVRTHPETGKPIVDPKKLAWFRNPKFRQAMAHAVDRPSIVKAVYAGRAQANFGYITAANKKWLAAGLPEYPFDPAKAKALLKEIGIMDRNGNGILVRSNNNTATALRPYCFQSWSADCVSR